MHSVTSWRNISTEGHRYPRRTSKVMYNRTEKRMWRKSFDKRFLNFCNNSPLALSYSVDDDGVTVMFPEGRLDEVFDYSMTVGDFIHDIKEKLLPYYPIVGRMEKVVVKPYTNTQIAMMIARGKEISEIPMYVEKEVEKRYRVDKHIVAQDTFNIIDLDTGESLWFKVPLGLMFIRSFRNGRYSDELEAGEAFFSHAEEVTKGHEA